MKRASGVLILLSCLLSDNDQMEDTSNRLPWHETSEATACSFALAHLVGNLQRRLTIDGRIHAETYISAIGAIAGFAAQRTLFAENPEGIKLHRAKTTAGHQYWYGDPLNNLLVPVGATPPDKCVWSVGATHAVAAGLEEQRVPQFGPMFGFVSAALGGPDEGKSSVPAKHQAHMPAIDLLRLVWPTATMCFTGRFPEREKAYPAAPVIWWSSIAAWVSARAMQDLKEVFPLDTALTLLMEAAIYCSKLDAFRIEGVPPFADTEAPVAEANQPKDFWGRFRKH